MSMAMHISYSSCYPFFFSCMQGITPSILSTDLLVKVLQYVDQRQRLCSCALVCQTWKAAATAATTSITAQLQASTAPSLQRWFNTAGSNVTSITLSIHYKESPCGSVQFCMPFQQLQNLKRLQLGPLQIVSSTAAPTSAVKSFVEFFVSSVVSSAPISSGCSMSSSSNSSSNMTNSLGALTALTSLQLRRTQFTASTFAPMSTLSNLEELQLSWSENFNPLGDSAIHAAIGALTQLTKLALYSTVDHAFMDLSAFSRLQDLRLSQAGIRAEQQLQLPVSLTRLHVDAKPGNNDYTQRWAAALCSLTNLRQLKLYMDLSAFVQPSVLPRLHWLQHLDLAYCDKPDFPSVTRGLLSGLQHLTNLQHLDLCNMLQDRSVPAAAYASLSSSSALTFLDLTDCYLPVGVIQGMFPQQRQLPALIELRVGTVEMYGLEYGSLSIIDSSSLQLLVNCCPALQQLYMGEYLAAGVHLERLSSLSELTSLELVDRYNKDESAITDDMMAAAAPHLTRLRGLSIFWAHKLTMDGLRSLTQLTALTSLSVHQCAQCTYQRLASKVSSGQP